MQTQSIDRIIAEIDMHISNSVFKGMKNIDNVMDNIDKKMNKTKKSTNGMNMVMLGFGLSMLFTGMAVKRFAESSIRALSTTFMTLADEGSVGVKRVLELQAAFQFLKFAIFETFANTDLFGKMVEGIVNIANGISEFVQKHPQLTQILGVFLITGVVLGGIAMVLGQLSLLAVGLQMSLLPLLGIILIIATAITLLFFLWQSDTNETIKWIASLGIALIAISGILALTGSKAKWVGSVMKWAFALAAIPAIIYVASLLWNMIKRLGGVWNAWKALGAGVWKIITLMIAKPLEEVFSVLEAILKVAAKFGSSKAQQGLDAIGKYKSFIQEKTYVVLDSIDKEFGMDRVRAEQNLPTDASALFKSLFSATAPVEDIVGDGSSQLATIQAQNKTVERTSVDELKQLNTQSEEMKKELEKQRKEGININEDGVTKLSKAIGIEVSKETVQALFNSGFITSSTEY